MHPAFSVVFFTTASGAGYGLLALTGILFAFGALPLSRWFGGVSLGLALSLVTAGLLSSTAHLGRPERAWRAFSQWRSSWLSREGVLSVLTYIPAGLFGIGWVIVGDAGLFTKATGFVAACLAVATVATTAMIYASLKPVAQWHSRYTLPGYLIFSVMTGAVLLDALLHLFGAHLQGLTFFAIAATALGWGWKIATWRHNDALGQPATPNSATGLAGGTVRSIEWPHTKENYLLKEMGYRIARKHLAKLRGIVHATAFAMPLVLLGMSVLMDGWMGTTGAVLAALVQLVGILIERWLFFAEAKHTVMLYYGR